MPLVASAEQVEAARSLRELIAAREDVEDLISIGAYKPGSKPLADKAIELWPAIQSFLRQGKAEPGVWNETLHKLQEIAVG